MKAHVLDPIAPPGVDRFMASVETLLRNDPSVRSRREEADGIILRGSPDTNAEAVATRNDQGPSRFRLRP
jgi:hypothetical protein